MGERRARDRRSGRGMGLGLRLAVVANVDGVAIDAECVDDE